MITRDQGRFLFEHLKFDKKRKEKYPKSPHRWYKRKVEALEAFNKEFRVGKKPLSRPTLDALINKFPMGIPKVVKRPEVIKPKYVEKYEKSDLLRALLRDYAEPRDPSRLSSIGLRISGVGLDLFTHWRIDPTTLSLKAFEEAFKWDMYIDEKILREQNKRQIRFEKASALRIIMTYAGFNPKVYKWASTKGLKRRPKRIYLEEQELIKYVYGINEPDTLVLARLGFEGGGRFSATGAIKTTNIFFDRNLIQLTETKTDTFPLKPYRPCTMDFVRRYIRDFGIIGKMFYWDYDIYEKRLVEAGFRAGLWRYKKPEEAEEHEIVKNGRVYQPFKKIVKGKLTIAHRRAFVGKRTTSHLMKHTFVSLGSIHGLSYESLSDITATDIGTLKKWYMGTGRRKTLAEIHGKVDYVPYWKWIDEIMNPHWVEQYNAIKSKAIKVNGIKMPKT